MSYLFLFVQPLNKTLMTLLEKNKLIASNLLGWKVGENNTVSFGVKVQELNLNLDNNWQFLCVQKIAEIEGISVLRAYHLLESFYPFVEPVMELEQIFEAIFHYVERNTPTHEHLQN